MKALILAAGKGSRLGDSAKEKSKALVSVEGKELLCYQLDFLNVPKIKKIGLVVGYHGKATTALAKKQNPSIEIFENKDYEKGNILSLKAALPFLDDDCLILNVDHIYPKRMLSAVLEQADGITVACDFDRPLVEDDMKITKDAKDYLKEIDKGLKKYDGGYIGMTFCPRAKLPAYRRALEKTLASLGTSTCVEKVLATLAAQNEPIGIADTSGIRWLEVDTLYDLKQAEETLQKNPNFLK